MPETGTLVAQVFTGRARIPVRDATVSIMRKDTGGKLDLVSIGVSDANGRIPLVQIPTPAITKSQNPGERSPFAVCDVWVEHPQYGMLIAENVQVFSQTESIQPLLLHPLSETRSNSIDLVDISPQEL